MFTRHLGSKRSRLGRLVAAAILSLLPAVAARAVDVTGTYRGTWTSEVEEDVDGDLTVTLTQTGDDVSGSLEITNEPCLGRATITGRVNGDRVSGTFASVDTDERGEFDLTADGDRLEGDYEITNGCFDGDHGRFVLVRQSSPPTFTPTSTPTRTPTGGGPVTPQPRQCVGDCGGDSAVTVDELVRGVNIALGTAPLSQCFDFDDNSDGQVTVDELVKGVSSALEGCTSLTRPTDTPPVSGSTPTPTATPTGSFTFTPATLPASVPRRVAGLVVTSSQSLLAFSDLLPLLLAGGSGGGAGGGGAAPRIASVPIPCPNGGTIAASCTQVPPRVGAPTYNLTAANCTIVSGGNTQVLHGSMTVVDRTAGHRCLLDRPTDMTVNVPSFTSTFTTSAGSNIATLTGISGSVVLSGTDPECTFETADFNLSGSVRTESKAPGGETLYDAQATFANADIEVEVIDYGTQCDPINHVTNVAGNVTYAGDSRSFSATYSNFSIHADETTPNTRLILNGRVESSCFGTTVLLQQGMPLAVPPGAACPIEGDVIVDAQNARDRAVFTAAGGVDIDLAADASADESFPSCLDPRLYVCPAM